MKRREILELAADHASLHGLNDITIGVLARESGMSKAGLHGLFGSKLDLQLQTIEFAIEIFIKEVIEPTSHEKAGVQRVRTFCEGWMKYVDRSVFPGGCFFGRVSMEGASLSTEINKKIVTLFNGFRRFLIQEIKQTNQKIEQSDAAELGDQLLALIIGYNWSVHSLKKTETSRNIRHLIYKRIEVIADM